MYRAAVPSKCTRHVMFGSSITHSALVCVVHPEGLLHAAACRRHGYGTAAAATTPQTPLPLSRQVLTLCSLIRPACMSAPGMRRRHCQKAAAGPPHAAGPDPRGGW